MLLWLGNLGSKREKIQEGSVEPYIILDPSVTHGDGAQDDDAMGTRHAARTRMAEKRPPSSRILDWQLGASDLSPYDPLLSRVCASPPLAGCPCCAASVMRAGSRANAGMRRGFVEHACGKTHSACISTCMWRSQFGSD
jgi:hypothetical protein